MSSIEDLRMVVEQMLMGQDKIGKDEAIELKNIVMEDRYLSPEERSYLESTLKEDKFTPDAAALIRDLLSSTPSEPASIDEMEWKMPTGGAEGS